MNKITFYLLTFLLMLGLLALKVPYLMAGILTLTIMMSAYIYFSVKKNKGRLYLLNQACDPEVFIEETEKQIQYNRSNKKAVTYLTIDKAAGMIALGDFYNAKGVLLSINKAHLSKKNGSMLVYYINLLICMYELNEIDEAEKIYEENITDLIHNPKLSLSLDLFLCERLYYIEKYQESQELLQEILNKPISLRARLGILYRLALIDLKFNKNNEAHSKLREVAEQGNKLWITDSAHELLKEIQL